MKHRFRLWGGIIFALLVGIVLFVFAMFQGDRVSWFLFFGYMPVFLYECGTLIIPAGAWKVERELSHHIIQAGEKVSVRLIMERKWPWPLFLCVVEELFPKSLQYSSMQAPSTKSTLSEGNLRRMKKILFPGFSRKIELHYMLESIPRGVHEFVGLRLMTSDCFGLVKKEHIFPAVDKLISYPNDRNLAGFNKGSMMNEGNESGPISMQATNVASGARTYISGDRISSIDWKKTAQLQQLMTKEFEQEIGREIVLILDACAFENGDVATFETSIELALGLIRGEAKQMGGTFLSVGKSTKTFKLADSAVESEILHHLAAMKQEVHKPFSVKLKEELLRSQGAKEIIIITTNLNSALEETIIKAQMGRVSITLIVVSLSTHQKPDFVQKLDRLRMHQVRVLSYTSKGTAGGVK